MKTETNSKQKCNPSV